MKQLPSLMKDALRKLELKIASVVKTSPVQPDFPAAKSVQVGDHRYVFGFDWRYYASKGELTQILHGCLHTDIDRYAIANTKDMVGLGHGLKPESKSKGKPYAAALVVADNLSRGGVELFVFQFTADLFGITVLQDSRPVARFDQLGTRDEILSLAGQFQLEQAGQDIRQAGNTGLLENEEPVDIDQVFFDPTSATALRRVPNFPRLALIAVAVVVVVLAVSLVWYWINAERLSKLQADRIRQQDPNHVYEQAIDAGMRELAVPAQVHLSAWRQTVLGIPESRNGWVLDRVACSGGECVATWSRTYGSFHDFDSPPLPGLSNTIRTQKNNDPAQPSIQTAWPTQVPPDPAQSTPSRDALPSLLERVGSLSSQLQDLSLLGESQTQISAPALHPKLPNLQIAQIRKPVVKGNWSLRHELWTLSGLELKGSALVVNDLLLERDPESKNWTYTLNGHFYAKGSSF